MKINYKGESAVLKRICEAVNGLTEDTGTICGIIGDLEQIDTEDKSSLVAAVNEVRGMVDGILGGSS